MNSKQIVFSLLTVFLTSCMNSPKQVSVTESGRLAKLSHQSRLNINKMEEKKISQIVKLDRADFKQKSQKTYAMPNPRTEESLYAEVLHSYQSRDLDRIDYFSEQFIQFYPRSIYSDNAIYLKGQLNLAMGLPSEALRSFERVLKDYPSGNKRVSALFGKGVAYRKLQLFKYSQKVFAEVKRLYPGSPEFFKVDLELKLLQVEIGV